VRDRWYANEPMGMAGPSAFACDSANATPSAFAVVGDVKQHRMLTTTIDGVRPLGSQGGSSG
jgi:hypothetical protein